MMGEADNPLLKPPNDKKAAATTDKNKPSVMLDKA